jgi:hypothetical protein
MMQVVVYRHPPAVHVFNVVEHGRRFYQELIFSSSNTSTFRSQLPSKVRQVHSI